MLQSASEATETYTCLQLLGELLLERQNVKVMMSYVSDAGNLKLMMTLLKDSSRSIQFEAFHVFKVRHLAGLCPHLLTQRSLQPLRSLMAPVLLVQFQVCACRCLWPTPTRRSPLLTF